MSIEDYYTETVILTSQTTSTGWGSEGGYSTAGTSVSASVNPITGMERYAADRKTLFADYKLHCSDTVSIDETYRAVWGGKTLDVVFVKDTLNMGHHKTVYCLEKSDA